MFHTELFHAVFRISQERGSNVPSSPYSRPMPVGGTPPSLPAENDPLPLARAVGRQLR